MRRTATVLVTVMLAVATLLVFKLCVGREYAVLSEDHSGVRYDEPTGSTTESEAVFVPDEPEESESESDTPAPDVEPEPDADVQRAQALLDTMTLEEKIYQLFITTPEGLTNYTPVAAAGAATQEALESKPVGGILYTADNLHTRSQITDMIRNTQSYSRIPLFICVEEEGGSVAPLSQKFGTEAVSSMAVYGAQGDAAAVQQAGQRLAATLTEFGFNLDFAPVAETVANPNETELGARAFGDEPEAVAALVQSMVQGLQEGGVVACLKYFPGQGNAVPDSALGRLVTNRTLDELEQSELVAFRRGIEAGASVVMLSHMAAPSLTGSDVPCDLSPQVVTELLRGELGYRGVVITDAQNADAITKDYSCAEAAVLALQAGCDIILLPENLREAAQGVRAAVESGALTEARIDESVLRILTLKFKSGICTEDE